MTAALLHRRNYWRIARWTVAAGLLVLPAVAMRFTTEVNWTGGDFVAAAILLGVPLLGYEAVSRRGPGLFRLGVGLALVASFLLVWVNLAVGIIGSENNPANQMYAGVLAVAVGGAFVARGRAAGLRWAMLATAGAQWLVAGIALAGNLGTDGIAWPRDVIGATVILTVLWLAAAGAFALAARR